jgi:hypothetical protein
MNFKIFPASILVSLSVLFPSPLRAVEEPQRNLCEEASQLLTEMDENGEEVYPGFRKFVKNCVQTGQS